MSTILMLPGTRLQAWEFIAVEGVAAAGACVSARHPIPAHQGASTKRCSVEIIGRDHASDCVEVFGTLELEAGAEDAVRNRMLADPTPHFGVFCK